MDDSPLRHIPAELIFEISASFGSDHASALNLAQTCQYFNKMIMPNFLRTFSLENASDRLDVKLPPYDEVGHFDVLSVLVAARTTIPLVQSFSCHFPAKLHHVITHFHRLVPFISRLSSLGSVEVVFSRQEDWSIASGDIKDLKRWIRAFESLFNSFVEKGCSELAIKQGNIFNSTFFVDNNASTVTPVDWFEAGEPSSKGNNEKVVTTLKGQTWSWLRASPPPGPFSGRLPSLSQTAKQNVSQLKTLRLASNFLVVPPCSEWVFALLKHANNLTALEIVDVLQPYEKWLPTIPILVSCLSQHKCLESLVIHQTTTIPVPALLYLLSSLPFLRRLSLDASVHYVSPLAADLPSIPPKFPHLEYMQVPSDYLAFFLTKGDKFPALMELWLHPRLNYFPEMNYDDLIHLSPLLHAVARQCSTVGLIGRFHTSEAPVCVPSGALSSPKPGFSRRISGIFKSLQEGTFASPSNNVPLSFGSSRSLSPSPSGQLSTCFDLVTALVLSSYGPINLKSSRFHDWMSLFPNVTSLQLLSRVTTDGLKRLREVLHKSHPHLTTISAGLGHP